MAAVARWRGKLKIDFSSSKRGAYKWLSREYRGEQFKKGNSLTANASEIDLLVRPIWEPIVDRSPVEIVPSWPHFFSQFQRRIPDILRSICRPCLLSGCAQ